MHPILHFRSTTPHPITLHTRSRSGDHESPGSYRSCSCCSCLVLPNNSYLAGWVSLPSASTGLCCTAGSYGGWTFLEPDLEKPGIVYRDFRPPSTPSALCFLRRSSQKARAAKRASAARPPTTPPAMAPVLWLFCGDAPVPDLGDVAATVKMEARAGSAQVFG